MFADPVSAAVLNKLTAWLEPTSKMIPRVGLYETESITYNVIDDFKKSWMPRSNAVEARPRLAP